MNKFLKVFLLSTTALIATPDVSEAAPAALAIAGAAATTAIAGGITIGATTFGLFSSFLIRAGLGLALNALAPKPKIPELNNAGQSRGYLVTQTGSALDHQIVYGKARIAGVRVFDETTGTDNKFLHRVIAFAGHEIDSFDEIYINGELATLDVNGNVTSPSRYNGFVRINEHLGASDQTADSDLVAEVTDWTTNHRLRGVAYLYIRLKFDADVFPNGVPEITATIKGKRVYDPRTDTTAWSDNPALVLRDYITSGYGLGEETANVDDTLVQAAANVCDETDTLGGDTRYTCNGAFLTSQQPYDTISDLLSSMGGLLWYAQGKWRMKPAYWTAPSVTFTEDDLRGPISIQTRHSRRDNFNTIRGTFRGPESNWQPTDYEEITSTAYLEADNGQESVLDFPLNFTDSFVEARRIARIALERNRQQLTIQGSFGLKAFQVQVGDVVSITNTRMGWTNKPFEIATWTFGLTEDMDLQVQMTLRETAESIFDEVDDGATYETDNTTLLSPFEVPTPSLDAAVAGTSINNDGTTIPQVSFSWSVTDPSIVDYYDFQYKLSTETDYNSVVVKQVGNFILSPAISGAAYDYRVRAVNLLGVKSPFASSASPVSTGDDGTTPNAPTNLVAAAGPESIKLTWDAPTQNTDSSTLKDLFQYRIYRNDSNDFGSATLIGRLAGDIFTDGSLVGGTTYYYWVTALDYTGNESSASTVASATASEITTERTQGVFYIGVTTLPTTSSGADTDFVNATGLDPVDRDQAWFYTGTQANPTAQSVWIYEANTDTWNEQEEVIDGDLVVSGTITGDKIVANTITADKLNVTQLDAISGTIGTFSSAVSGARVVISDSKIEVYDASNNLRVKIGDLS